MPDHGPPDNPLSATSLTNIIAASLPRTSDPQLKTPHDAIAIAAHACLISVGFRLIGLGEDHKIEASSEAADTRPLPEEWNANAGHYAFRYKHNQSSMEYLLKVNRMGNKAVILAMGLGDDRTNTFDIGVSEFTSAGNLPASPAREGTNPADTRRTIENVFINIGRLSDFGSLVRIRVIQKLMPGLSKAGYAETADGQSSSRDQPRPDRPDYDPLREPARPRMPLQDPLAHPRRQMPDPMPGFDDEHEILRPPRGVGGFGGPNFGDRDLYPAGLGPNDPFRGGVGPGLNPLGGGMHPTFDDPLFAGQGRGNRGYDPQAPPGSRYDPIGPGSGHPRGAGLGGRPPNPFGGFGDGDFI
ncbi:hypothetical protein AMS68_005227 [Peltaster fructicola]|uniref:Uncharacterized protein n=1 Tax=Peltaster fructicola TaxID=286661 RepID=A0A6H0XZ72_9PEZI|nr:hypothetical protein AMS68_005227 [Peltaster fructicola]